MQKRLAEMGRKGQEDYEAQLQEEDFLKSMEEVMSPSLLFGKFPHFYCDVCHLMTVL